MQFDTQIRGKTSKQKLAIKATIARNISGDLIGKHNRSNGLRIDILESEPIGEIGIRIRARAFRNKKQIGFGKDGSVDIETFNIYNFPILVDDPNGDIVYTTETNDELGIERKERKLREDPVQALKEVLEHNISLIGKDSDKIVKGKVGNTTSTIYSTTGDGYTYYQAPNTDSGVAFATARAANGNNSSNNNASSVIGFGDLRSGNGGSGYVSQLYRGHFIFDTSSLTGETISSAIASFFGNAKYNDQSLSPAPSLNIYESGDDTETINSTYETITDTEWSTRIAYASYSTSAYNDFTLNETGLTGINKSGNTYIATREASYDGDNVAPSWQTIGNHAGMGGYFADEAGTAQDPKLVIEHETASAARKYTSFFF